MVTDWTQLAREVGSLHASGESGGTSFAQRALERLLGEDAIREAVEHAIAGGPGSELAMNVLRHIGSLRAVEIAYEIYRASTGDRASQAVWLIKHVAHPRSVEWVAELLADPHVAAWGVGLLDQLVWCERVEPADVEHLIVAAEQHADAGVREQVTFIRAYLADREAPARREP